MKYAVLGTGMVGHSLATKLISLGHEVRMGARFGDHPAAMEWASQNGGSAGHGTFAEVAAWADRVIVAAKGSMIVEVAQATTNGAVAGKTVIDVTNPLDMSNGMPPTLIPELSNTNSAAEALQNALPDARVVKALNTMNHEIMVNPGKVAGAHEVFVCGDDSNAKSEVFKMLAEFGWDDPVDLGPLAAARGTEGMMPFWLRMWGVVGNANFNYKIQRG